jgi:hypothetical protein
MWALRCDPASEWHAVCDQLEKPRPSDEGRSHDKKPMRTKIIALTIVLLTLLLAGCASGLKAGGRRGGVEAGTASGPRTSLAVPEGVPARLPAAEEVITASK